MRWSGWLLLLWTAKAVAVLYDGGTVSPLLSYGVGARAYAMGNAATALAEDTTAVFWNPAGLSGVHRREIFLYYDQLFQGVSYLFGGYAHPWPRLGVFAASVLYLGTSFRPYDADLAPLAGGGEMTAYQWVVQFGFGQKGRFYQGVLPWMRFFEVGAGLKVFGTGVGEKSAMGVGLDAGLRYHPHHLGGERWAFLRNLVLGVKFNNLVPPTVRYASVRDWYLWDINVGAVYRAFHETLTLGAEVSQTLFRDRAPRPRFGVEYKVYRSLLMVRAGYNGELTFGAGVELDDFTFDYAYGHNLDLGGVHHVAVAYRFGDLVP